MGDAFVYSSYDESRMPWGCGAESLLGYLFEVQHRGMATTETDRQRTVFRVNVETLGCACHSMLFSRCVYGIEKGVGFSSFASIRPTGATDPTIIERPQRPVFRVMILALGRACLSMLLGQCFSRNWKELARLPFWHSQLDAEERLR